MGRKVVFYKKADSSYPTKDFLESLSPREAQKATWSLRLIEDLDVVPKTYFKKIENSEDIWESRSQLGSNIFRVFCFQNGDEIVTLHGIRKKHDKISRRDIEKAESYRKEFFGRSKNERS